jgi:hypothetical protein
MTGKTWRAILAAIGHCYVEVQNMPICKGAGVSMKKVDWRLKPAVAQAQAPKPKV